MEDEIRYPKSGDTLIKETGQNHTKVLFAEWMTGKWDFYADAYKEAADKLVNQIEGHPWEDRLVCPIIFMYRHFVELKLKSLIINLDLLSGTRIPEKQFNKHVLPQLWSYIKAHLNCIREGNSNNEIMTSLDQLIGELSDLDPDSMHFRYSHDKNFQEMPMPRCLSMEHFKTIMEAIGNGLAYIEAGIDLEKEARALDAELQAEINSYMDVDFY